MKEILYVTGNARKFEVAKEAMRRFGFPLVQRALDTPEIQSENVNEVAAFSAKWASDCLQKPVIVTDTGYYIEALSGFPGPFVKFINKWLTSADILNLMRNKKNRDVEVMGSLAYCEPGESPVTFMGTFRGKIALFAGKRGTASIDEIFIPSGFNRPESEIPREEMVSFWGKDGAWQELVSYLNSRIAEAPK